MRRIENSVGVSAKGFSPKKQVCVLIFIVREPQISGSPDKPEEVPEASECAGLYF